MSHNAAFHLDLHCLPKYQRETRRSLYNFLFYLSAHAKLEREMMSLRDWDRLLSEHALMDTKVFSRIKKAVKRFVALFHLITVLLSQHLL